MKIVALVDLPTYGEGGGYINAEASAPGQVRSTCYMSNDLWVMGGMSDLIPVPNQDDPWPWYLAYRPSSDHSHEFQNTDTCNIYLAPAAMWDWMDHIINVAEEVSGGWGSVEHLRGLADLLVACPEFDLGEPVLTDQAWPRT